MAAREPEAALGSRLVYAQLMASPGQQAPEFGDGNARGR